MATPELGFLAGSDLRQDTRDSDGFEEDWLEQQPQINADWNCE
jgi:hypothetical protein